jgi:hypothetical protein
MAGSIFKIAKINCFTPALIFFCSSVLFSQNSRLPAFPGAEGAGAFATGGRGGEVYIVTNLNAKGPGSLQDAVSAPNRFVVFAVSGVIDLLQKNNSLKKSGREVQVSVEERIKQIYDEAKKNGRDEKWIEKKIERAKDRNTLDEEKKEKSEFSGGQILVKYPNITIAGQTAPGEGITLIHGSLSIQASNVIVRNIRVRRGFIGEGQSGDGITVKGDKETLHDIIIDHCSSAWTTDENITMTGNVTNGTVQYSIAAEGCDYYNFGQTPPRHSEGSLFGSSVPGGVVSFHHIIYANNRLRNPRVTGGNVEPSSTHDLRNCVISNWVENSSHTGSGGAALNLINNYYKPGVNTWDRKRNEIFEFKQVRGPMRTYLSGNYLFGNGEVTQENWKGTHDSNGNNVTFDSGNKYDNGKNVIIKMEKPFDTPFVTTQSAQDAYELCLEDAGATVPSRDYVDYRIVRDIRYGAGRVLNTENDLPEDQRWPTVWSLPAPGDSDNDGMPDYWEKQFSLNAEKNDSMDDSDSDGYVNIEEFVNNTDPKGGNSNIVFVSAPVSRSIKYEEFPGEIKVTRTTDISRELKVKYIVSGTAEAGKDFKKLSGTITIPADQKSAVIKILPLLEGKVNMGTEPSTDDCSVIVTLSESEEYSIGCPLKAMVVIKEH